MKKIITLSLLVFCSVFSQKIIAQGNTCSTATPFCSAVGAPFIFPNNHSATTAPAGPAYGCLCSEPNPSWFYIKASTTGVLTFNISQSTTPGGASNLDVDFVAWGPFTAATFPNACNALVGSCTGGCSTTANPGCAGGIVDCSYSTASTENMTINAIAGDYYIVMITNFNGGAGYIDFTQTGGASTDCSITCPGVATGIGMGMQDNTGATIAPNTTLSCSVPFYLISNNPALSSNPGDITAPCISVTYNPALATIPTKENVTVLEGATTAFQFCPGACANGQMYQYGELLYELDSTQSHSFIFCGTAGGAAANTTVSITNCWSGANLVAPQAMNIKSATCYTLTVPAGTDIGYAYYTITPASGASGVFDYHDGYLYVDPNALPSATTFTATYHFKGPDGCAFGLGSFVFTSPTLPNVTVNSPTVCAGSSVNLTAAGANTYTWNTGSSANPLSVTPGATSYTVTGTNTASGCTNTAISTVTVNSLPTITLTASPSPSVCLGSSTSFTASGASTYTWTSSANGGLVSASGANVSATPTSASNATYTVNATDANGCKNNSAITINVNPLPTLTLTASSATICSSTTATLTASGANTYTWSSSAGGGLSGTSGSSVTASPTSSPATYTVIGTNTTTGCQGAPKTTTITITATPTISLTQATFTTCLNSSVTFTASGASTYTWTPTTNMTGSTTANPVVTPTSTTTTVYSVTGSSSGCTSASAGTVTLTVNPLPTISVVPSSTAICSGGGSSTLTASGASTYTWANAATLSSPTGSVVTATPTTTTIYTVTGTNANNCVNKNTVSITVNQTPTVTVSGGGGNSQTVCGGGLANATINGITFSTTPAGSVNWTNSNTNLGGPLSVASGSGNIASYAAPSVAALTTGVITVSGTTAAGCTSTNSTQLNYTITINPIPGETGDVITPAGCGMNNGTIIGATGTGGSTYSYQWNNAGGFVASSSYTNGAGTYPLQIKDNATGCIYSQNFTIPNAGAPPAPTVTASATSACVGGTVILTAPTVAGVTYNWTEANGNNGTGDTYTVTNMPASPNPYTIGVTATSSGCTSAAATTSITVNPLPTPAISSSTSQICQGSSTTLSVTPTGNYSYQWGNTSGTIAGATSNTLTVTAADTYSVMVTDNTTNCSASTAANGAITVNALPTIDTTGILITQTSCTVATGAITNVTITGAPTITYTWTSGSAGGAAVSNGSGASATLSNAGAGVYCLNVTDGNTCQNSFCSITITNAGAPPSPTLTASGNDTTYCQGDPMQTLTVTTTGTVTPTVNWYSDAGLTTIIAANTNTYTPSAGLPVGTTTLYVAAIVNGCTSISTPITITINPTPTININPLGSNSVICNGASVIITPNGATSYTLNPGNQIGTSFTVSPTSSTTYTIDGTDGGTACSNSVAGSALVPITVNPTPTISINPLGSNSVICNGASVVITPSGAASYTLNPGNQIGTSFTVSPNSSTTYTIDGSDGTTACQNATADAGLVPIIVNPTPTISVNPLGSNSVICNGASVVITPGGAASYTLNPGNQIGTSFTVSPTSSTTYTIDGSDGTTACQNATADAGLVPITVNPTPTISINPLGSGGTICNGASVLIVPTGAASYTLNPGNITGTSFTVNPTSSTTYTIEGSDATTTCQNATADAAIVPITVNPTPTVNVGNSTTNSADCGQATGGVTGINNNNVSGGTAPYSYQWTDVSNGAVVSTDSTLNNQGLGTYNLQVTDANGCVANTTGGSSTFTVPASAAVQAAIANPNPTTGTVPLAITFSNTSVGAISYAWSFGDGNNSIAVNPTNTYTNVGTYTVVLIAANGPCTSTVTLTVIANIPTTIIIPNIFSPNGDGTNDEFYIPNTGMSSLNCDIFNRWGQLLHTITAPDQGWDGIVPNGDKAPEGTYMYMLQAIGLDGKTYKQQGTVTLVR